MKRLLSLLFASLFVIAGGSAFGQSDLKTTSGEFEVRFTNQTSFDDVVNLRNEARSQGVEISYNKLVFDSNSKLQVIELTARGSEKEFVTVRSESLTDKMVVKVYRNSKGFGGGTMPVDKN